MTNLYDTGIDLWQRWTRMWNGHPSLARELVAPVFALHLPLPTEVDAATIADPAAVERWVAAHLAKFTSITYRYDAGPYVDAVAGVVAGPWVAEAVLAGAPRSYCGLDTLAFRDGKVTEYWTLAKEVPAIDAWITARQAPPSGARLGR